MKSIDKKICYIYAGVNGAGKSILYRMNQDKELGKRVNIDEILTESKDDLKSNEEDSLAEQCKMDLYNARQNAIKNGTADMSLDEINKVIYG